MQSEQNIAVRTFSGDDLTPINWRMLPHNIQVIPLGGKDGNNQKATLVSLNLPYHNVFVFSR
jgi:hypothetical protein